MLFKYRNRKAFTLVEVLIVMGIIGILAAISMTVVARARKQEAQLRLETCKANIVKLADSMEAYKVSNGFYPIFYNNAMGGGGTSYDYLGTPGRTWAAGGKTPIVRCPLAPGPGGYHASVTHNSYEIWCGCSHEEAGYAKGYPRYKKLSTESAPRWFNDSQAQ
ncbi:MAG: type II secretion system protein [Clostridia bacterium]|nr:type II secretion system protein [Clostridia bacterium]